MKDTAKHRKAKCYAFLRSAILTLELAPGSDLDEAELSEQFGLSRTPLREVLRQLAGEGYTELHTNRGARVSELSYTKLREFFLAAPMVYGAILQLAASAATEAQIEQLKQIQEDFKQSLRAGSGANRALANNQFHDLTGEMAHNIYLLPSFKRLLIDHARISMTFYRPQNAEMLKNLNTASQHHDAIIDAIAARDETAAARLAEEHWNLSRNQIEMFVIPSSLDVPLGALAPQPAAKGR